LTLAAMADLSKDSPPPAPSLTRNAGTNGASSVATEIDELTQQTAEINIVDESLVSREQPSTLVEVLSLWRRWDQPSQRNLEFIITAAYKDFINAVRSGQKVDLKSHLVDITSSIDADKGQKHEWYEEFSIGK
jgi:hypothetical protein